MPLDRFVRENLPAIVDDRRYFGRVNRRLRKKRAKSHLRRIWGFGRLSQLMVAPIRRLDYEAIGRKVLSVEHLPMSALPAYGRP